MTALGTQVGGIFSNNQPLADNLMRERQEAGEKLWQLPLVKEYKELIKSSVADMKNIGGAHGGAITAALILQEFVAILLGRIWTSPVRPSPKATPHFVLRAAPVSASARLVNF
jgi:leucyl aminopeptidase